MTNSVTAPFRRPGKTLIFIDGLNTFMTAKMLDFKIDFALLLDRLKTITPDLVRVYYYTTATLKDEEALTHTSRGNDFTGGVQRMLDLLRNEGYEIIVRAVPSADVRVREQGNTAKKPDVDVLLAVEAMYYTLTMPDIRNIVLFSGDGDFIPLVRRIKDQGIQVTVVSSGNKEVARANEGLRYVADDFVDLKALVDGLKCRYVKPGDEPPENVNRVQCVPKDGMHTSFMPFIATTKPIDYSTLVLDKLTSLDPSFGALLRSK